MSYTLGLRRVLMISPVSGYRCSRCLEKIMAPSTEMSKMPLLPLRSSGFTPSASDISAANLAARGRYFH